MPMLTGRKAICAFMGVSWTTVKRWIKCRGLPVVQERGMQPTLLDTHVREWQDKRLKK